MPYLEGHHANSTGSHRAARAARRAVEDSRDELAAVLGVLPEEVVFTSGGTESDNIAIFGARELEAASGVVVSAIEHPAVAEPAALLSASEVGVDRRGCVDVAELDAVLDRMAADGQRVGVVSIMTVNNEVGSIQPIAAIAESVRERAPAAVLHTDAVQAIAWIDLRPLAAVVDSISLSAHKFGGPKGVGALTWRSGAELVPRQRGGGQERERRSGTHNVAGIVGMTVAAKTTDDRRDDTVERVGRLRDRLVDGLLSTVPGAVETGVRDAQRAHKIAGNAHVCIPGIEAEALLFLIDEADIAASAGSSCASGAQEQSPVLTAMGVDESLGRGALRLSLGWSTADGDVDHALAVIPAAVERLRATGS